MTLIENDNPKVQYTGPFSKGQLLPLTFPYVATEDVKMIIDDKPGIFNVDYEIYPNSAYIKNDLPNAKQITLYRATPLDQQAPFPQQGKFRSERVEQALDKLTMQQQEQEEQLSRCIIAPITLETFNGQLPAPAADQALKWNAEGTELENYDIIGEQEAFETEINTKFEEQSTTIENRIGQFEESTNTQFSEFRNEINENLDAVLNAADKLDTLDQQVQAATDAANTALTSATRADEYAEEAVSSANQAEDALEEIKQVVQNVEDTIGELVADALNNKVDLDGGNYPGSGLEAIIKDNGGGTGFNLFDTKISDYVLEGDSAKGWALQGTYVSGGVYPDFYAKCLEEYNEATNTETVNGVTVKVHSNGHKFYDIADKTAIDEFYNSLGSAWFYGIDTENERIFLPRDKYFAVTGKVGVAGNGKALGLTDGTRSGSACGHTIAAGAGGASQAIINGEFKQLGATGSLTGLLNAYGVTTDPTKSGIEGKLTANTEKYLYICVGNTIVNDSHIDVGKVLSEAVLRSSLEEVQTVIETYQNGTSWYRIWSNGLCEQGGVCVLNSSWTNNTFLKPFKDMNYSVFVQMLHSPDVSYHAYSACAAKVSNTTFQSGIYQGQASWQGNWYACGRIW